ncbi:MAG: phosphoenolpyruvate--protein phosphotransferase [Albidovulum sp.]|nr:phosphoenolpyruvate--protein phosphotransferase [Albidovulum sp.]
MSESSALRVLQGLPASGGLAFGRCHMLNSDSSPRELGLPDDEMDIFEAARSESESELQRLIEQSDELGGEILEFQAMLLDDDSILGPVRSRISKGEPADAAWSAVLDGEISEYEEMESEYLAARAVDLKDLRERVLRSMAEPGSVQREIDCGAVIVADVLGPSAFLEIDWTRAGGLALGRDSATGHVAILARSRGVPMIVGVNGICDIAHGRAVLLDGDAGTLTVGSSRQLSKRHEQLADRQEKNRAATASFSFSPAKTKAGRRITVSINVGDPAALVSIDPKICDGIGLVRTEFLFARGELPSEDVQTRQYRRIVNWAQGRPVTIRTLDAGGDKPVPGLTVDGESNPFLGTRGLRLSLLNPDSFKTQLRAIARAAALGPVKAMLPMVTATSEFMLAREHLDDALADLEQDGARYARPELGIMVETPAAALTAGEWPTDFYSIGSNDLVQYVTACARDNPDLSNLSDPMHPAVLELIGRTIQAANRRGVEASLCGEMASMPSMVPVLLSLGLEAFSVDPSNVAQVKMAIAEFEDA